MLNYVSYQCTICRRTKDIVQDTSRVVPNLCIITKGCSGRLLQTGTTTVAAQTPPVSGVVDWYPRGESRNISAAPSTAQPFLLSTSVTGILTIAVKATDVWVSANPSLTLKLIQRRTDDITYMQYQYNASNIISGRDINGKILKFNLATAAELVVVHVDNVLIDKSLYALGQNTITFTTPLSSNAGMVAISVYSQTQTIPRQLTFTANQISTSNARAGSWNNINWIEDNISTERWYVYTCDTVAALPKSAKFKVDGIYDAMGVVRPAQFMLSSAPYENVDRYLNYAVDLAALSHDFDLITIQNTFMELGVNADFVTEIYPPFKLIKNVDLGSSSFTLADSFSTSVPSNASLSTRLSGAKILGPT